MLTLTDVGFLLSVGSQSTVSRPSAVSRAMASSLLYTGIRIPSVLFFLALSAWPTTCLRRSSGNQLAMESDMRKIYFSQVPAMSGSLYQHRPLASIYSFSSWEFSLSVVSLAGLHSFKFLASFFFFLSVS